MLQRIARSHCKASSSFRSRLTGERERRTEINYEVHTNTVAKIVSIEGRLSKDDWPSQQNRAFASSIWC